MFVGTLYGLDVSKDGGDNFTFADITRQWSIGAIAINPNDPDEVIAGVGWRDDYGFFKRIYDKNQEGVSKLYKGSVDNSDNWSWQEGDLDNSDAIDRNIFTLQYDPRTTKQDVVYAGAADGVFISSNDGDNWTEVNKPSGMTRGRGCFVSPDGRVLYAVYLTNSLDNNIYEPANIQTPANYKGPRFSGEELKAQIFATLTDDIENGNANWISVMKNLSADSYWYPEVDPRSTQNKHKIIVSFDQARKGLFEREINWDYNNESFDDSKIWKQIWSNGEETDGWDIAIPNARFAHYTPNNAGWDRAIWSTSNQTIYRKNFSSDDWENKYSKKFFDGGITGNQYTTRGTASTFTFDVAISGSYVVQAQADNGLVESYDNANTWNRYRSKIAGITDAPAVDIATLDDTAETKVVVAVATRGCYGGICFGSSTSIFIKTIKADIFEPDNDWIEVQGSGKVQYLSEPFFANEGRYREVSVSPAKPNRVFFGVNNDGIYMIDNIGAAFNSSDVVADNILVKLFGDSERFWVRTIAPHPTNENIFYFTNGSDFENDDGVYRPKGLYQAYFDGTIWQTFLMRAGRGNNSEVAVWEYQDQSDNTKLRIFYWADQGGSYRGDLSPDNGANWDEVISPTTNAVANNDPYWETEVGDDFDYSSFGGIIGFQDTLIVSYYDHDMQLHHGIYKGAIQPNGNVNWENWSGNNLYFGGATTMKLDGSGQNTKLYMATPGAGLLRRDFPVGSSTSILPSSVSISGCNSGTALTVGTTRNLNHALTPNNPTNSSVTWSSSNTGVATVNANNGLVTAVSAGSATITVTTSVANKKATCVITVTSSGCSTGSNKVANPQFNNSDNGWNFWTKANAANASLAIVGSNNKWAKTTITDGGTKINFVQFHQAIGSITSGKTYEVKFKARAVANRSINVKVQRNSNPWTLLGQKNINLTTTVQNFQFTFVALGSESDARLNFMLGNNNSDVWIDAVVLREVCPTSTIIPMNVSITGCPGSSLSTGGTVNLNKTIDPSNATNQNVTWSSSNSAIATVSSTGLVTAVGTGSATITVATVSGNKTATCGVTVSGGGCNNSNFITNGGFESSGNQWSDFVNPAASASFTYPGNQSGFSGRVARVNISNGSNSSNHIQLRQNIGQITNGTTYEISFKAKAASNRSLVIGILKRISPYTGIHYKQVSLTSAVQQYNIEFTANKTMSDPMLDFFLGDAVQNVWIDEVVLREKCTSSSNNAPYRYLRVTGTGTVIAGNDINIQQIQWKENGSTYPNPELVWETRAKVTTSHTDGNAWNAYASNTIGWTVGLTFPRSITIDLGDGNEINPDQIRIKPNASDRGFSGFYCEGSNDNSTWHPIGSVRTGLSASDYSATGNWGTFSLTGGSRTTEGDFVIDLPKVSLYPNPMSIGQDLTIDASELSQFNMQIIGLEGRIIFEKNFSSVESSIQLKVDKLNKSGVYFVKFYNGTNQWVQKLIVN